MKNEQTKKERKKDQKGKKEGNFWNKQNKSMNKQPMNKWMNKQIKVNEQFCPQITALNENELKVPGVY